MTFDIWNILGIIAILSMLLFWSKGAVWGGLTMGVIIGFIIALFSGFDWLIVKKAAIIGTLTGLVAELMGRGAMVMKRRLK